MRVALSTFLIASLLKRGGGAGGREPRPRRLRRRSCGLTCAPLCRVCATFGQVENARRRHAEEKEEEEEEEVVGT